MVKPLIYIVVILFASCTSSFCQNETIINSRKSYWQLTNVIIDSTPVNQCVTEDIRMVIKNDSILIYSNENRYTGGIVLLPNNEAEINWIRPPLYCDVLSKNGIYQYEINYKTLYLSHSDKIFQFYNYKRNPISNLSLNIGIKNYGIALGNPQNHNGLKLNLVDIYKSDVVNGLGLALLSNVNKFNGVSLSIISNDGERGLFDDEYYCNGIRISAINLNGKSKGIQFGLINHCFQYKGKGALFGIINYHNYNLRCKCSARQDGFTFGIFNIGISTRGITMGPVNLGTVSSIAIGILNIERRSKYQFGIINHVKQNCKMQVGLINIQQGNPSILKVLPVVNFNFKKKENTQYITAGKLNAWRH